MSDIDTMSIDELRIAVAREVLGLWCYHYDKDYRENCYYMILDEQLTPVHAAHYADGIVCRMPDYPRDIAAAWVVVEATTTLLPNFGLARLDNGSWICSWAIAPDFSDFEEVEAPTAPEAICRAALKAVRNSDA